LSPELDPFRRAGLIEQALCRGMKGYFIGLLGLSDDRYRTAKRRTGNCAALFHKRNEGAMILPPVGCAGGCGPV